MTTETRPSENYLENNWWFAGPVFCVAGLAAGIFVEGAIIIVFDLIGFTGILPTDRASFAPYIGALTTMYIISAIAADDFGMKPTWLTAMMAFMTFILLRLSGVL